MRRRSIRGVLAALVLALAACSGGDDGGTAPEPTANAGEGANPLNEAGTSVTILAEDHTFSITDGGPEIAAGVVNLAFQNAGAVDHEVLFVEAGAAPLDQVIADMGPVLTEGGAFPPYAGHFAAPIELGPGESDLISFTLAAGTYALLCTLDGDAADPATPGPPHYERGMAQLVEVVPAPSAAALPERDGSITALDWSFDVDVEGGDDVVTFTNAGPDQIHFAALSVYPPGTTAEAARASFESFLDPGATNPAPPAIESTDVGFSGVFSAGLGSTFRLLTGPFESGRTYVVACFVPDRSGGEPHAIAYGMYEAFTVA